MEATTPDNRSIFSLGPPPAPRRPRTTGRLPPRC
jgi:hypothetical protein